MKTARLTISQTQAEPANSLIFGHFIEFMRDCIDEGMWAQLLKDRGFDRRKEIPAGVVDANPNIAAGWYRTGYNNTFEISLDSENSLSRDGYSQKINCYNDYDGFVGIAQGAIHLEPGTYEGYVWVKAEDTARLLVLVREDGGTVYPAGGRPPCEKVYPTGYPDNACPAGGRTPCEKVYHQQEFIADSQWRKMEFEFEMDENTINGIFEIRLLGEGIVWLDGASLMPAETTGGIWNEVFRHITALKPPVIRFPGGCFADCYHWEDGVGERDTRPLRLNQHWGGFEDNSFGTDEYMEFCENVGCEAMICVNFGSGTPEEAAGWVEYCNGAVHTPYGSMRAANGHPEPYGIKYWDIGNETFGDWEIGHCSAQAYAEKYLAFYQAMKAKDSSIVFMVCGGDGDSRSQRWNREISEIIGKNMDVLCLHMYVQKAMEGKHHDNRDIYYATVGAVKKYEEILTDSWNTVRAGNAKAKVAVTEYNLGTLIDSYREQTLEAAVFNGGMLNMFLRNTEKISMCNISDLVNGWPGGCIVSKHGHAFGTASYYVMKLYSESGIKEVIKSSLECPEYEVTEQIGNIEPLEGVPYVDAVVCRDMEGRNVIFAVNRCFDEEVSVYIGGEVTKAQVTEIYSEKTSDMNRMGEVIIRPETRQEDIVSGMVLLKPHSVNRILLS